MGYAGITMFGPYTPILAIGIAIVIGIVGFKVIERIKPSTDK